MEAAILERHARPAGQVTGGLGNQNSTRRSGGHDSRSLVYGEPANAIPDDLDFAYMNGGSNLEPVVAGRLSDRTCATKSPRGTVKGRQEPVPGKVDLSPAELREGSPGTTYVTPDQLAPRRVADSREEARGLDDVGHE